MSSESKPGSRILVIDDEEDAANSLALLLRLSGFEVRTVYDGNHAIWVARQFKPDCILSDIRMPSMDGYRIAELFRKDDEFKDIPLVAISGSYDPDQAKAAGFDYDFTKPADPTTLVLLLTTILRMEKKLEKVDDLIQKQGEVVGEAKELMKEVKSDMQEIKAELKDVKHEVQEIKEKLDDK